MLRDPIFKGCTRPAMIMGVPLVPLVAVFVICFMIGLWGGFLLRSAWPVLVAVCLLVSSLYTMRLVAKKDDQRFKQWELWLVLRVANFNRGFWGATSYAPFRLKKRR
jgi:type IV secretion system protein VirB3